MIIAANASGRLLQARHAAHSRSSVDASAQRCAITGSAMIGSPKRSASSSPKLWLDASVPSQRKEAEVFTPAKPAWRSDSPS